MSSSNVLRLLRDALVRGQDYLDLASGDVVSVRPITNDTGSINIGDGTNDMDVKVFLGSTSKYVLFDVGNSKLTVNCDLALAGAFSITTPALAAEHAIGVIGTGAAPSTRRHTLNGDIITDITVDLKGLASKNTADDVIGLAAGGAAYIGRNVVATNGVIYKIELICLQTPAGGDNDVNVVANSSGTLAYDSAGGTAYGVNGGDAVAGQVVQNATQGLTDGHYLYLTAGTGDTAASYTGGMFIIRLYGHPLLT